jgi:CRP/FNR family transcriptional regulator
MRNVMPISGQTTRCNECRHASDCPMMTESSARAEHAVNSRVRVIHDQDRIHRAGEPMDAVYRVRSGTVKTSITGRDGEEQVTGFYGPGEWIGLDALGDTRHRSDAVALETVSMCAIPYQQLRDHMSHSPHATRLFVGAVSERLARKERMHLILARDGAARRLAGFLLDLCERRDEVGLDSDHVSLPMSRGEIASYLALAVETVSRLLTRMQRAGTIQVHRNYLVVVDRPGLAQAAGRGTMDAPTTSTAGYH